jgi:hypothetical protein
MCDPLVLAPAGPQRVPEAWQFHNGFLRNMMPGTPERELDSILGHKPPTAFHELP